MRRWTTTCAVLLVACASPQPPTPRAAPTSRPTPTSQPHPRALVEAAARFEQGDVEGAAAVLRAHLDRRPDDGEARLRLGQLLDYQGKPERAIALWKAGVERDPKALALHLALARRHQQQAEDGPNVERRGESIVYRPGADEQAAQRYRVARARLAIQHFAAARALKPRDHELLAALAGLHNALGEHAEAARLWREGGAAFPKLAVFPLGLAYSREELGKLDEAARGYHRALELDPRLGEAHAALSKYYRKKGQAGLAREHQQRARFYAWAPASLGIAFSPELATLLEQVVPDGSEAAHKRRRAVIERLLRTESPASSGALAVLIHRHRDHGELEDRMLAALRARGKAGADLLLALLEHGQSTCTLRGAAHALARSKDPRLLPRLVKMLPDDTRAFFSIDVAAALATLGDPRAVPHLVRVLAAGRPVRRPSSPPSVTNDPMMASHGRLMARVRAALALGHFPQPEARRALERGLGRPELAPAAHAALHRLTRDRSHLEALKRGGGDELLVDYIRAYDAGAADELKRALPKDTDR